MEVSEKAVEKPSESVESVSSTETKTVSKEYDVFYTDDYEYGANEPYLKSFLSVNLESDTIYQNDIMKFDAEFQNKQSLYNSTMVLGEEFDTTWLLECLAIQKAPFITIYPNNYDYYNLAEIEKIAEELDKYYGDFFINLYPNPNDKNFNSAEYISFYQKAYTIFKTYLGKNVAVVFTLNENNLYENMLYYPEDEFVDWVGLEFTRSIDEEEHNYGKDIFETIDYVYYTFQNKKPIMISSFAISHFSEDNHSYYIRLAIDEMEKIYDSVEKKYPRIKMLNYLSYNGKNKAGDQFADNFLITDTNEMLKAYELSTNSPVFAGEYKKQTGMVDNELFTSRNSAINVEEKIYINQGTLVGEMGFKKEELLPVSQIFVKDEMYYLLDDLEKKLDKYYFIVDESRGRLEIIKKPS